MPRISPERHLIAALATGAAQAAIAVIRISGAGCHERLKRFFPGHAVFSSEPGRLVRALFRDPASQEVLDETMLVLFKAPRSYTGEDAAEVHAHGGPFIVQRLLQALHQEGFRPAEPGEFTRRAFLNGKLDLTAAEGIHELIRAQTQYEWQAARQLADGHLSRVVTDLRQTLIHGMAHLEALIDFPDEGDTKSVALEQVRRVIEQVRERVERLAATYESGRVASSGLRVALLGEPNAGKSTLLNALLRKERAIVTEIAGTTRDYLEETCLVKGRLVRLVDTAGLRRTEDVVEKIGVARSLEIAGEADLVLILTPADASPERRAQVDGWLASLAASRILRVLTKADLGTPDWAKGQLAISCSADVGLTALEDEIARCVDRSVGHLKEDACLTHARHFHAVGLAREAIARFFTALEAGQYEECLAFELQDAARALESLVGKVSNDDLLDRVFGDFCIGK